MRIAKNIILTVTAIIGIFTILYLGHTVIGVTAWKILIYFWSKIVTTVFAIVHWVIHLIT